MANPQLIVLVGVFLVAILLSFLFVVKEGFAKGGSVNRFPKSSAALKNFNDYVRTLPAQGGLTSAQKTRLDTLYNTWKPLFDEDVLALVSLKNSSSGNTAMQLERTLKGSDATRDTTKATYDALKAGKPNPAAGGAAPAAKKAGAAGAAAPAAKKAGAPGSPAAKKAAAAKKNAKKAKKAKKAKRVKKVAKKAPKAAAKAAAPAGMKFSELIQSLISYTPGARGAGGAPYATALGAAGAGVAAAGGAELVNEVRQAVRDEIKQTREGANAKLAGRATTPNTVATPKIISSPGLQQGNELRNLGALAQQPPVVVVYPGDFSTNGQGIADMSQMVPRTNVFGLA